jgi:Na+/H+ antiporter NhaD/arsenite permease-like protein
LDWLELNAARLGEPTPTFFFWGSGILSSVLDNAPTYLSFLSALIGATHDSDMAHLLATNGISVVAISVGSVFFGACTYIGNGPNFMVKSIADQQKVHAPSFLAYIFKFSLPVMLPMLVIVWLMFFR